MSSINTAVTHNMYLCTPSSRRDSNLENPKFYFETESCGMVSAPKYEVSPIQIADKTQQLMRSKIRRLLADCIV